jgi:Na+-translocating ferredoxin:NAD+ oxidoreductase subunit B
MINQDDVYRKLRKEVNKMPIPFPETASGVELKLLKHLFTPEEAEIALNLNILPETIKRIHKRVQKSGITITLKELEERLDNLVNKGAIMGGRIFESKGKGKQYSLAQLAIGMFEFQNSRLTKDYVHDFEQYTKEGFQKDMFKAKTLQLRAIPIGQSLTPESRIEPYNDMKKYVGGLKDDISVMNCVCRESADLIGVSSRNPELRETCLTFGDSARYSIGRGYGRPITNGEALNILNRAEEAGFVLQPENACEPQFICCCCVDCCHALKMVKMLQKPSDLCASIYYTTIDPSKCKGCKKCMDNCAMDAISLKDKVAVVNLDRCIGCGTCFVACKNEAHTLHKKEKTYVSPKNQDAMYQKIMVERYGVLGTLKTVARVVTGRKA